MSDAGNVTTSIKKRDLPAWGYLLGGCALAGLGVWFVVSGALEDSRRPSSPWVAIAGGVLLVGYGVREWVRNGSPTVRRLKSVEEQQRDEERARRYRRRSLARIAVVVGVVLVAIVLLAVLR